MSELKPCPVCGSEATAYEDDTHWQFVVGCSSDECGIFLNQGANLEELSARWNALPRPCKHEWMHVCGNKPWDTGSVRCSKCGTPGENPVSGNSDRMR